MEYFLTSELDRKTMGQIKEIVASIDHVMDIACIEYKGLARKMLSEINTYYEERLKEGTNIVHAVNQSIVEFREHPTFINQQKCNELMNQWAGNQELYIEQYGTWWACLKAIIKIENEAGLLPF